MIKINILTITKSIITITWFSFLISCANIVPPTGGPQDLIPPKLLDSLSYPNSSHNTNRSGHNISLVFNETTVVEGLKTQITSNPEIDPKLVKYKTKSIKYTNPAGKTVKGTRVSVDLNQKLDSNTTYVVNFGSSFKDINEGKVASNISIAFSTGDKIDSMSVKGKAIDNYSTKSLANVFIGLYEINDTITPLSSKPKYFTSTNEEGHFELNYIKNGKYNIYAFTDVNRNKKYDQNNEKVGFVSEHLNLEQSNIDTLIFRLFKENLATPKVQRISSYRNFQEVHFNKGLKELTISNFSYPFKNLINDNKLLRIYQTQLNTDSLSLKMLDSLNQRSDTTIALSYDTLKIFDQNNSIDYSLYFSLYVVGGFPLVYI